MVWRGPTGIRATKRWRVRFWQWISRKCTKRPRCRTRGRRSGPRFVACLRADTICWLASTMPSLVRALLFTLDMGVAKAFGGAQFPSVFTGFANATVRLVAEKEPCEASSTPLLLLCSSKGIDRQNRCRLVCCSTGRGDEEFGDANVNDLLA